MKTINILSKALIAKIAAGEVVERPASAVKELIENALDAEATHIDIELEEAGIKKIVVRDNGKGMSREDLLLSFEPHTTSKISNDDDLASIASFGFRGEALASIAAVSLMTIRSREPNAEFGTLIELINGDLKNEENTGMPVGTEITVESLFNSTPARKKFLKDTKVELRYCVEIVSRFALGFPNVGFSLTHNGSTIFHIAPHFLDKDRIQQILGKTLADHLVPLSHETRYGSVKGFIAKPQAAEEFKNHQYIFINTRCVSDAHISRVIKDTYASLLEPRAYPPFILYITLPHESVDVNIHPRKEEVAFRYQYEIHSLIAHAVQDSLSKHNLAYIENSHNKDMDMHTAYFLKSIVTPWNVKNINSDEIAQVHNLYLVTATEKGLLLIDQHAAHERILFEQFKEAFEQAKTAMPICEFSQPLLFEVSQGDAIALQEQIPTFQKIGFDIEFFGKNTFTLRAVPEIFKERDHAALIQEVLSDLKLGKGTGKIDRKTEKTLSYLACRSAIKAGDALTQEERKKLVAKLISSPSSYTCPHGRPTHIEVSMNDLDKMFKRK